MRYAHLVHVDGEAGDVDYETVLTSQDGFQLTYSWLRETAQGENVAVLRDGSWYVVGDERPYSDVCFTDSPPELVVVPPAPARVEGADPHAWVDDAYADDWAKREGMKRMIEQGYH